MFYMPQYHNLPDGRQVFLRFPDPELHAQPLIDFLKAACGETPFLSKDPDEITFTPEQEKAFLRNINEDPKGLMILAEVDGEKVVLHRRAGWLQARRHPHCPAAHIRRFPAHRPSDPAV